MLKRIGKAAQSTAEYAIVIAIVIGALVAMQVYVRRGLQARVRDVVDHVGETTDTEAAALFTTGQYEPYYASSDMDTVSDSVISEDLTPGGAVTKTISLDKSQRTGTQDNVKGKAMND